MFTANCQMMQEGAEPGLQSSWQIFFQSCFLSCPDQTGLGNFISTSSTSGRHGCPYLLLHVLRSLEVQWRCGRRGLCTAYRRVGHVMGWWRRRLRAQDYLDVILPTLQDINLGLSGYGWELFIMRDIVVSTVDALWLKGVPETHPIVSFRLSLSSAGIPYCH